MTKFESPLQNLKVASPCSQDWNAMLGDDRRRYCGECKLNVYNLSGMTRGEAENLLAGSEGRLCVRYFQRADGSVITEDCPVGWARVKQRAAVFAAAFASLVFSFFGALGMVSFFHKTKDLTVKLPIPFMTPTPVPLMGAIAAPKPTPKQSPSPKATPKETMGKVAVPKIEKPQAIVGEIDVARN